MKTNYLLPNNFKRVGWVLFSIGIAGGIFMYTTDIDTADYLEMKVLSIYHDEIFREKSFFKIIYWGSIYHHLYDRTGPRYDAEKLEL